MTTNILSHITNLISQMITDSVQVSHHQNPFNTINKYTFD